MTGRLKLFRGIRLLTYSVGSIGIVLGNTAGCVLIRNVNGNSKHLSGTLRSTMVRYYKVTGKCGLFDTSGLLLRVRYGDIGPLLTRRLRSMRAFVSVFRGRVRLVASVIISGRGLGNSALVIHLLTAGLTLAWGR